MPRHVSRSPGARRGIVELADYISQGNVDAALRFLDAINETFRFLATNHQVGEACRFASPGSAAMRVWPVQGYRNYLIFYRPTDEGVEILRVLHGARDIESLFGDDDIP